MLVLFQAIKTKFDGNSALKTAGKNIYLNDAPQNTALPYVTMHLISNVPDDTFGERIEVLRIQFSIFSDTRGSAEVGGIFEALKTCFDYCDLTVTGYSHVEMRRDNANLLRNPDDASWQYVVDYKIILQKT